MQPSGPALLTDLYELTMLQAYHRQRMEETAVFDLYVRDLPESRSFLIAAGLEDALAYLEELSFSPEDIEFLTSLGYFDSDFLAYLAGFRFRGSVRAMPEGTPVFAGEPILEVIASLPQAQLVETYLLNQITFQTMIASKGARVVQAAAGKPVVDFGARRTHGTDAALKAARALYLVGFAGTSNVLAGKLYGIPLTGTMAHSYIQAHAGQLEAFRSFVDIYPETVLLVDTYDTEEGVRDVVRLAREMRGNFQVRAVRLDSGDLARHAFTARRILDEAGLLDVGIVASGGLDEYAVARLVSEGAPVSVFAVGTNVGVSADAPKLETVYKLVAYGGRGTIKLSVGKATLPGPKQVYRRFENGVATGDIIAQEDEAIEGQALLLEVMRDGRRLAAGNVSLEASREFAGRSLEKLPPRLFGLERAEPSYPVVASPALRMRERELREQLSRGRPSS